MTDIYTNIAANFSQNLWRGIGQAIGHGTLAYGAHKLIDYVTPSSTGVLSWLNPLPKIKKGFAFLGLEAAIFPATETLATTWGKASPIAGKLLTPSIKSVVTPAVNFLEKNGYITLNSPSAWSKISNWASQYHPVTVAHNLTKWWSPIADEIPTDTLGKLYRFLDESAPAVGQFAADTLETGVNYAKQAVEVPGEMIKGISEATGLSYPTALILTGATTLCAYYGVKAAYQRCTAPTFIFMGATTAVQQPVNKL